jgi:hypothetical protein
LLLQANSPETQEDEKKSILEYVTKIQPLNQLTKEEVTGLMAEKKDYKADLEVLTVKDYQSMFYEAV